MRRIAFLLLPCLLLLVLAPLGPAAASRAPIEDYASYQPATKCRPHAKPGAVLLQQVILHRFGGRAGRIAAPCDGTVSEHHEGRALDWMVDARTAVGRRAASRLFAWLLATDGAGNEDARARRLGVMYLIWDDRIYSSYRGFEPEKYRNAACRGKKLKRCSPTLRHLDHVHVSLTRAGGKGLTSWFAGRL